MPDLDRAARARLVADATALQTTASRLLAARDATRKEGEDARRSLAARPVPFSVPRAHDLLPAQGGTGQGHGETHIDAPIRGGLLALLPQDSDLLRQHLAAQHLRAVSPGFDVWLRHIVDTFPTAIQHAAPRSFFRRIFGRSQDAALRDRATSDLLQGLTISHSSGARHDLEQARPIAPSTSPLAADQILRTVSEATHLADDRLQLVPTRTLRAVAMAVLASAEDARAAEGLERAVKGAAEKAVDDAAAALLADIDMDHFRTRVSVGRFPASALERAGIRTVADLLSWRRQRLIDIDGIGPGTADALLIGAQQLRDQARDQAKIDLTPGTSRAVESLLSALKALIDDRLLARGADADRAYASRNESLAQVIAAKTQQIPAPPPFASSVGHAPALLIGENRSSATAMVQGLTSFPARLEDRRAGRHLTPEERARLDTDATHDIAMHGSEYFALLAELGFEDRIAQNTHGDLPEDLVRQVETVDLNTELLTLESLRRYQHFAARFIVRQRKVIIGDEMGLGKTIEALAAIAHLTRAGSTHTLVICPAAVVANWIREIETRSSITAHRLHGAGRDTTAASWQQHGGIAVTTFETLGRLLRGGDFDQLDTVVVDEAHKIKNPEANRTRNSVAQLDRASHAILMTGTPIENRLEEFRTLIGYLAPSLARSAEGLLPVAFRQHIAPAYLRRNQEDVLKELPELNKIEDLIEFSAADRRAYEAQVAAGNFMGMRRAALEAGDSSHKVERLREILEDAQANGRKVIVFSFFRTVIEALTDLLSSPVFGPISGAVGASRRQEIVDDFSAAPGGAVLLSQIQAGGEGLNIQAASVVVICEPQLKPSLEVQAIARAHRMGQERSVQVHRLVSNEGIDPRIVELLAEKTMVFDEYARESATKDSDQDAVQVGEVAIGKRLVAEEQARVQGMGAEAVEAAENDSH